MHDLDAYFGDLHSMIVGRSSLMCVTLIVDREIEIVQRLIDRLKSIESSVLQAVDVMAELDW
jgi:hypothetical protein